MEDWGQLTGSLGAAVSNLALHGAWRKTLDHVSTGDLRGKCQEKGPSYPSTLGAFCALNSWILTKPRGICKITNPVYLTVITERFAVI